MKGRCDIMMNSFAQDYMSYIFVFVFSILFILSITIPISQIFSDYLNNKYQGFIEKDDLGYFFLFFLSISLFLLLFFLV